jgi:hypothetical protein
MWRTLFNILYFLSCFIPYRPWREWFRREKLFDYHAKLVALRNAFPRQDWRHFRLAKGGGSLVFMTPNGTIYKIRKFHLKDDSVTKFTREKRITDAIRSLLPVRVPNIKIHQIGIFTVYETKFISGKILLTMPLNQIREHRAQIGAELGNIIYILFNSKLPELNDLRPKGADKNDIGLTHGDMCSNILVDPKTMKITGIIDWEYANFSSLKREFFGLFRVRRKMRLTDIAPEAIWEYYRLRDSTKGKTSK